MALSAPPSAPEQNWHADSSETVLEKLNTTPENGLSTAEAQKRLTEYGHNELREKPPTPFWRLVLDQLRSFVVLLLIGASIISAVLGEQVEAIAIIAIVILNTVIGVIQESRAEASLAALKKLAAPDARVIRDGARINVPARELVPGDVVMLEAGNFIPADVRLVETVNLRVEEAALTGESVPSEKKAALMLEPESPLGDRKNMAFMGTVVSYGRGSGVVVGTGLTTQIGLIAQMLSAVEEEETPLQKRLEELGRTLSIAALIVVAIVFAVGLWQGQDLLEGFIIAISLAIAAVPEGLPAVVTITLALGMREMVKRHALVRRLASVETLGSASVICTDKTGTLTQNAMTTVRLWAADSALEVTGQGYEPHGVFKRNEEVVSPLESPAFHTLLWVGALVNDALLEKSTSAETTRMVGDPTEGALVVAAAKANLWRESLEKDFPRVAENPFDSARKTMSTLHAVNGELPFALRGPQVVCVKGAPDVVLQLCSYSLQSNGHAAPLTDAHRQQILDSNTGFANQALRVLGVAVRVLNAPLEPFTSETAERELIFVGLAGLIDPARPEVAPAVAQARSAGIRSVMITGDYPDTARTIAQQIGLLQPGRNVLTGAALDKLSPSELLKAVQETDVFARVSPQNKVMIVDALQKAGAVTAMTGDGVNDAPALKRADIGVAMGITGTDVAKEAADMVLTDDNYASIVAAVEQGRIIYANIRKFVFFLLSSNVAEIMIIFLATLAGLPTPLTAIQLLWLNLITDGAPALALAMEKGDPDVMQRPPRPKNEPIVNRSMGIGIVVQTIAQTGATLTALLVGLYISMSAAGLIPAGANPLLAILQHEFHVDPHGAGGDSLTSLGQTMAFVTLSLCELFRAYTVRSERASLLSIGIFSNRFMQMAVGFSLILLVLVVNVPFLQPIFNTSALSLAQWGIVVAFAFVPAIAEEITKWWLRRQKI
jgi:Ca2+-transporting ATPase